jgi:hypothetical protein
MLNTEKSKLNNGAITCHLSKNQSKHLFAETSGEKLVAMLQIILDAGGGTKKDKVIMKIQETRALSQVAPNIPGSLVTLTDEYHGMDAVSLKWGLDHFRADYNDISLLYNHTVFIANNNIYDCSS